MSETQRGMMMEQSIWKKQYDELISYLRSDKNNLAVQQAISIMKNNPALSYQSVMIEGLMGIGNLAQAEKLVESMKNYKNDDQEAIKYGIFAIANLLKSGGRVVEALVYYEAGLQPDEVIHCPRMNAYGKICREMALSRFGDNSSSQRLLSELAAAQENNDKYLVVLASAYILVGKTNLHQTFTLDFAQPLLDNIDDYIYPGLKALAYIATICSDCYNENTENSIIIKIIELILRCEGIKGDPNLIDEFYLRFQIQIQSLPVGTSLDVWMKKYLKPVLDYQKRQESLLFPNLPNEPLMKTMDCLHCDGRCCYDGVYITTDEENEINKLIRKYPEYFQQVPPIFTEAGEWGFLFHGKRTIRVSHEYLSTDYPSHFLPTKCVFAYSNGECALQKVATEKGYHPWKFKPASCWQFPLIGLFNENAMERPHYFGMKDPGYCDDEHPGYLAFMPCSKTDSEGITWKRVFKNEIQYYLFQLAKKNDEKIPK